MMFAILPSKRKENIKRIESKLFVLVDRKEKREQNIDDHGRELVIKLREYLQNEKSSKYTNIMKEAERYIKKNEHYY